MIQILYLVTLFGLNSCSFSKVKEQLNPFEGTHGVSYSLEDSKKRKVFKYEVSGPQNIILSNGRILKLKTCWKEHKWTFKEDNNKSQIEKGEQLVIEFEPNQFIESYLIDWVIIAKSSYESLGLVGNNSLVLSYSNTDPVIDREFIILADYGIVRDSTQISSRKIGEFTLE